jgi:hypothetical protein
MEATMKNILLLVHADDGQEARLQTALDLTRALDGHLTCIDVTQSPVVAGDLYAGFGEAVMLTDEREDEARNKAALTERLSHEDVRWDWTDATGDIASCVLEAATLADLIVLNRTLDAYPLPDMRTIASRILMHARKPIVAVPENLERLNAAGRALIAWDVRRLRQTRCAPACPFFSSHPTSISSWLATAPRRPNRPKPPNICHAMACTRA